VVQPRRGDGISGTAAHCDSKVIPLARWPVGVTGHEGHQLHRDLGVPERLKVGRGCDESLKRAPDGDAAPRRHCIRPWGQEQDRPWLGFETLRFALTIEGARLQELCTPGEIERRVDATEAKALQKRRDGLPDMFTKDKQWARRVSRDRMLNHCAAFPPNPARVLAHRSVSGERAAVRRQVRGLPAGVSAHSCVVMGGMRCPQDEQAARALGPRS
jgi:hypothetical protein